MAKAKTKEPKDLSFAEVKKQDAEKYKETKRVIFGDKKVDVDVVLRPTKKALVIAELLHILTEAVMGGKEVDNGKGLAISYALIVKHFTSLNIDGAEGYDGLLSLFYLLSDNEYMTPIFTAFNQEQLASLLEEIGLTIDKIVENEKKKLQQSTEENKEADIDAKV